MSKNYTPLQRTSSTTHENKSKKEGQLIDNNLSSSMRGGLDEDPDVTTTNYYTPPTVLTLEDSGVKLEVSNCLTKVKDWAAKHPYVTTAIVIGGGLLVAGSTYVYNLLTGKQEDNPVATNNSTDFEISAYGYANNSSTNDPLTTLYNSATTELSHKAIEYFTSSKPTITTSSTTTVTIDNEEYTKSPKKNIGYMKGVREYLNCYKNYPPEEVPNFFQNPTKCFQGIVENMKPVPCKKLVKKVGDCFGAFYTNEQADCLYNERMHDHQIDLTGHVDCNHM